MLAVSSLPLFVQCPRAFYFKETAPVKKRKRISTSTKNTRRPAITQILPPTSSRILESQWLGLRGQCKFLQEEGINYPTVFRNSAHRKPSPEDLLKLTCYSLLLENCSQGRVANPSTGAVFPVCITEAMRNGILGVIEGAKISLISDYPPKGKKGDYCLKCVYRKVCGTYSDSPPSELIEEEWIIPESDDSSEPGANSLPLYLQEHGSKIGITGETFVVMKNEKKLTSVPVADVSQIVIYGNIQISSQALRKAFKKGIQVLFFNGRGDFSGYGRGLACYNARIRPAQFQSLADNEAVEHISKRLIEAKISNCRAFLMRNGNAENETRTMKTLLSKAMQATGTDSLRGYEGTAARLYFSKMGSLLKGKALENGFIFAGRTRRPPKDPLNALLSFGYSLLSKEFTVAIESMGLDPMHGYYHASRSMRPALSLDLMEPYRPLISDSIAITILNKGILSKNDFVSKKGGFYLTSEARKRYIIQYEKRLNTKIRYNGTATLSYRNAIRKTVYDLKSYLLKTQPEYQPLKVK